MIASRHNHLPKHTSYDPCEARELYVIENHSRESRADDSQTAGVAVVNGLVSAKVRERVLCRSMSQGTFLRRMNVMKATPDNRLNLVLLAACDRALRAGTQSANCMLRAYAKSRKARVSAVAESACVGLVRVCSRHRIA